MPQFTRDELLLVESYLTAAIEREDNTYHHAKIGNDRPRAVTADSQSDALWNELHEVKARIALLPQA